MWPNPVVGQLDRFPSFLSPIVTAARVTPSRLATSALLIPLLTKAAQRSHLASGDTLSGCSPTGLRFRRLAVAFGTSTPNDQVLRRVNTGDPLVPSATPTEIPPVLPGPGPTVLAYPRAMVIAEKLVTALQRGAASTRWRDFADLYLMIAADPGDGLRVVPAIAAVAKHRGVPLKPLGKVLAGMPERAQSRWESWLEQQGLADRVPRSFAELLDRLDERTRPWIAAAATEDSNSNHGG